VSYVTVVPEAVMASASDLANLGSTISAAVTEAAAPTTSVVAAAQDEVSTAIAAVFGSHARQFQALSAKVAEFHDQFVRALTGGAASYVEAEVANAAAATTAADEGNIFGAFFRFLFGLGAPQSVTFLGDIASEADSFFGELDQRIEGNFKNAELAARALRVQQIVTNGLKLIGQDGAQLYTNGREIVAIGGKYPFELYTEEFLYRYRHVLDAWGWTDQNMQNIFKSEIRTVFRGEGLVQHALQKVGSDFYHIQTDAQGQILSRIATTEATAREILARVSDLSLLSQIQKDVYNAINQAEEHALRQADQAARQLAEQALREAQRIVEEAERAGLIR